MNNKWLRGCAIFIVPLIFFLFLFRIPVIEIQADQHTFFVRDDSFILSWIHSVENEPWYEVYERQKDKLILTETYFKTFGAGVPSNLEIIDEKDGFVYMKVDRQIDELNVIVSENVQTTITIGEKDIELYKIVEPYSEVNFFVKKLYLWNLFEGEFL